MYTHTHKIYCTIIVPSIHSTWHIRRHRRHWRRIQPISLVILCIQYIAYHFHCGWNWCRCCCCHSLLMSRSFDFGIYIDAHFYVCYILCLQIFSNRVIFKVQFFRFSHFHAHTQSPFYPIPTCSFFLLECIPIKSKWFKSIKFSRRMPATTYIHLSMTIQ